MCSVFIWEQTATCATYSINWLVFITEMKSVYSAVRTGYLNKAVCACMCFVFIWEQTTTCATYSINWLVFITQMKSVYSAVRTGYLNKAVCTSSLKGLKKPGLCFIGQKLVFFFENPTTLMSAPYRHRAKHWCFISGCIHKIKEIVADSVQIVII